MVIENKYVFRLIYAIIAVLMILVVYLSYKVSYNESMSTDVATQTDDINTTNDIIEGVNVNSRMLGESIPSVASYSIGTDITSGGEDVSEDVADLDTVISEDPYKIITNDIESIKGKDISTVQKYFGVSDIFTADAVADKLTASIISFVSSKEIEGGSEVVVHICTLDYDKMQTRSEELKASLTESSGIIDSVQVDDEVKTEVAKGVVNGDFDIHYNIPVKVVNNNVIVTEEYKQALTGNWYNGIGTEITEVDCNIDH